MVDMNNALRKMMSVLVVLSVISNIALSQLSTAENILNMVDPTYPPQGNNDASVNFTAAVTPVIFNLQFS